MTDVARSGIHPMLATIATDVPSGDGWVFEPKYDGIRIVAAVTRGDVHLISRNGIERTADFPDVASAVRALADRAGYRDLIIDGELVARTTHGIGRFGDLQQRSKSLTIARHVLAKSARAGTRVATGSGHAAAGADAGSAVGVSLMVFDLLLAGKAQLVGEPWHARHDALVALFRRTRFKNPNVQLVTSTADGPRLLQEARRLGWEGVIAKQTDSVYDVGHRSRAWRKLKLEHEQEFVIGGYTEPRNSREHLGAILLGHYQGHSLVYAGLCGTGFTERELSRLSAMLRRVTAARSPFAGPAPRTPQPAHWVRPVLVAQVRFSQWTADGKLRHPVYLGLRDDKAAVAVHREPESVQKRPRAGASRSPSRGAAAGTARLIARLDAIEHEEGGNGTIELEKGATLALSNLGKVFFPKTRTARAYTKGDLLRYYVQVAPAILPAIADHPLVLRRFPNGIAGKAFYQHKAPDDVPRAVRTAEVEAGGNVIRHLIGGDLATLLYAVQLGAISIDPWHSRVGSVSTPDYTVIDLDPGTTASFPRVVDVALWVKEVLDELGLHGVPKTSGMTGIHIMLPLAPGTNEDAARIAAQLVATAVAERHPKNATVARGVQQRGSRQVYVDYLQNIRGKTVAGVYAARAHPLAQVSMPVLWDEVDAALTPAAFTIETAPARLAARGDLWATAMRKRNDLRALLTSHAAQSG